MKIIAIAVVMAILGGLGAARVLNDKYQEPAYEAYATGGARVGDPGDNLVGRDWPQEAAKDAKKS